VTGEKGTIWTRDFILLFIINNALFFGFQMITPNLPKYASTLGAGGALLGVISGAFAAASFVARPFAGRAADRLNKNLIQRASLGALVLVIISYGMVVDLRLIIAVRFLHGLLFGVNQTTTTTMVALLLPEDRMTSGIGMFTLGMVVSMGIAPAIGIWVMDTFGYVMFFQIAGAVTSVAFLFTFLVSKQPILPLKETSRKKGVAGFYAKEAAVPASVILLNASGFGVVSTFLILHGEARNIQNVGIFFTAFSAALLVSRILAGKYADRLPARRVLYPCSIMLCVAMLLLWRAQSIGYFIAAAIAHGICNGFSQPILQTMALLSVEPERRGVANGTYFMGVDIGNGISPVIAGAVASVFGYGAAFLYVVLPVTIGIFILIITDRKKNMV